MRTTVLTLSLTMMVFSGLKAAVAQDSQSIEQAQYQQAQPMSAWQDSDDDSGTSFADALAPDKVGVSPRYWFTPPDYGTYFQADALFLSRFHGPSNQPIAVALPPGSIPNLHTDDVSLSNKFRAGAIFTLGLNIDQVSSIEATYFGLNSWTNSASVSDPTGQLGLAGTLQNSTLDYIFSDRIAIDYHSQIHSAEGNYKQTIEGLTLLAGFRYFRLAETFDINSHSAMFGTSSDYKVNATNQFAGCPVGHGIHLAMGVTQHQPEWKKSGPTQICRTRTRCCRILETRSLSAITGRIRHPYRRWPKCSGMRAIRSMIGSRFMRATVSSGSRTWRSLPINLILRTALPARM